MKVKFGVNTLVWVLSFTEKDFPLLDKIAGMGFDAVEITPGVEYRKLDPAKLSKKLDDLGLEVTLCGGLDAPQDFSSDDASIRENGINFMIDWAAWAKDVGAEIIGGPLYSELGKKRYLSPEERKAEWDRSAESLKRIGDGIAKYGITIALEPINRFEIDMINTSWQAFDMCEQVNHPNIKLMLDTFHMNIEDRDIGDAIRSCKKHLVHFHTCSNNRGIPGEDHVPWADVLKAFIDIDYEGFGVIESFAQGQVAAFANIWRPLVEDQDDIPREGLQFLKKALLD
ncbi:MAG: sugar phosphate isomerase/epimerase [Spirochaetes bacterium]|nr:sugar phosphate isomerase/epimerase [Spirochaetota bacterium]